MATFAFAVSPLINALTERIEIDGVSHEAFAVDISCAGEICELRKWWECL